MSNDLSDPAADPLAKERGSRRWTARRRALAAVGAAGLLAFAFGVFHSATSLKGGPSEPESGLAATVSR